MKDYICLRAIYDALVKAGIEFLNGGEPGVRLNKFVMSVFHEGEKMNYGS